MSKYTESSESRLNDDKAELPHPVYACVFRIALRFWSSKVSFHRLKWINVSTWKMQCNAENECVNGKCECALKCVKSRKGSN